MLLPDLHTGFSKGRSGGLVFPSLSEFSRVCCAPHSQIFGIVNKAEVDIFWNSCFFHDPMDVGNLISGSSAFSKSSLNIQKFLVHILLKPGLENFKHYFTSVWDECNCAVVWAFFGIAFLWNWNENWPFPVLNQSTVPWLVLTVASWPAYRFLRQQVRWTGIPISWRIFQFVVIYTAKGFGVIKAEVDVFLEFWTLNSDF